MLYYFTNLLLVFVGRFLASSLQCLMTKHTENFNLSSCTFYHTNLLHIKLIQQASKKQHFVIVVVPFYVQFLRGFEVQLRTAWRDYGPLKRLRSCDRRSFYVRMNMYVANCTCVLTLSYTYFVPSHRSSHCQASSYLHYDYDYYFFPLCFKYCACINVFVCK